MNSTNLNISSIYYCFWKCESSTLRWKFLGVRPSRCFGRLFLERMEKSFAKCLGGPDSRSQKVPANVPSINEYITFGKQEIWRDLRSSRAGNRSSFQEARLVVEWRWCKSTHRDYIKVLYINREDLFSFEFGNLLHVPFHNFLASSLRKCISFKYG